MKIFIFAVLLLLSQLSPPVFLRSSTRTFSPTEQTASTAPQQLGRISEIPPVSVKRDWADVVSLAIAAVVAVIAGIGVSIAVRTLNAIEAQVIELRKSVKAMRRQGLSMRRQTTILRKSLAVSKEASDAARDNAIAAKDSAESAALSARALINAERAWVMVEIRPQIGPFVLEGSGMDGESTGLFVNYICHNLGNSFAQITEKGYVVKIVDLLSQDPDFAEMDIFHHASEYVKPSESTAPYKLSAICKGHRKPNNLLVIYGKVRYTDVFGDHETTFGYSVSGMGQLERLPADSYGKYNNHT